MKFKDYLKEKIVYLDGGMGTLLQERGLKAGEHPELWSITKSKVITEIHKAYFDAGSNVISTNTFGANSIKFKSEELESIIKSAFECASAAKNASVGSQEKFIALDIGPTGKLLKPYGDLDFEDAAAVFAETVRLGVKYGAELIIIETMNDSYETKAALLAAKENCELPVIVTNAYGGDGKLMTGASPEAMALMLEGMGADAIGANCSLGPRQLSGVIERLIACASVPVVIKPNAGLPRIIDGKTVFDVDKNEFSEELYTLIEKGARVVGGCCGTTPEYIRTLTEKTAGLSPKKIINKDITGVCSYTHAVIFDKEPILIGERINPTGKKRFKEALLSHDIDYILSEAARQSDCGAHILDVNVGLPSIDEAAMLTEAVCEIQAILDLPLQIDTADSLAMERALRRYNGKALINSVSGKQESMDSVFPLAKKYGGAIIALTLDENGIPDSIRGRVEIAKKILSEARKYGIDKKDIIFDTLTLTVGTDGNAANVTLGALKAIKDEFGCRTSLGVSNISYGLPSRDAINSTFFALALDAGLSAAIMNPYSSDMMRVYHAYRALRGLDESCLSYISAAEGFGISASQTVQISKAFDAAACDLKSAIIKGFKDRAADITRELLINFEPLKIVDEHIIPALDIVGEGYEAKRIYLPQLLMSAEAAKAAFGEIRLYMSADGTQSKGPFVIATVKGDIHDIGKNIVKLILENYGYNVIDLGKDVEPQAVVEAVRTSNARFVGLSALMTTTLPAMEKTVKMLHEAALPVEIIVGGAVLNDEFAKSIGADFCAADAMDTVRYCEKRY